MRATVRTCSQSEDEESGESLGEEEESEYDEEEEEEDSEEMEEAAAAIANVGPGLGPIVGPSGTYAPLPDTAKWVLSFGMLLGRLEFLTVLVLFAPSFWRR